MAAKKNKPKAKQTNEQVLHDLVHRVEALEEQAAADVEAWNDLVDRVDELAGAAPADAEPEPAAIAVKSIKQGKHKPATAAASRYARGNAGRFGR